MLEGATSARDAVVQASRELSGTLRIGAEQCLGLVDVATLLERFHRRFPQVRSSSRRPARTTCSPWSATASWTSPSWRRATTSAPWSSTELGREPLVVLLPPDHPLAGRSSLGWRDLAAEDFIDFHPSWALRPLNDAAFAAAGVHRRVRLSVNDVHTLLDLVDRGLGVAVVPQHVAAKPQAARLTRVPLPDNGAPEWVVSVVAAAWDRTTSPAPYLLELLADTPACAGAEWAVPTAHCSDAARRARSGSRQRGAEPGDGRAEEVVGWGRVADHERWWLRRRRGEPVGVEAFDGEVPLGGSGDGVALAVTVGELQQGVQPGSDAEDRPSWRIPTQLDDQMVPPSSIGQPPAPDVPVVAAGTDELGQCELVQDAGLPVGRGLGGRDRVDELGR